MRKRVKVMVGCAPVTQQFAQEIGAGVYSGHAGAAVALAQADRRRSDFIGLQWTETSI